MDADNEQEEHDRPRSPTRADFYRYEEHRRDSDSRNSVAIDKTTAMIVAAIASAALAVGIAGGTALVQKVDESSRDIDRGRAERIADFGEVSKNISVIETKLNQLIGQVTQLELRIERRISLDLEGRDKKIDLIEKHVDELRDDYIGRREKGRSK